MNPSSLLTRVAVAISIAVHAAAVALSLGYAGAGLYDATLPEAAAVSLVTPEEAAETEPTPPASEPKPEPDLSKLDLRLSPLDSKQQQPSAQAKQEIKPETKPEPKPQTAQPQASAATAKSAAGARQQQAATQAASQPAPMPAAQPPAYSTPQPDLSLRYQVDLGLKQMAAAVPQVAPPSGGTADFDAPAMRQAEIGITSIAAFRARLKQCAELPAAIAPDDKVVIVLRAIFTPDARLAAAPILIEASASAKGPALMQAAIAALKSCQPHTTLPADKYAEWRVLEMRFTPQDFKKG